MSEGKWQFWGTVIGALIGFGGVWYGVNASREEKKANEALDKQEQISVSQNETYQKLLADYERLKKDCQSNRATPSTDRNSGVTSSEPTQSAEETPNPITWDDGAGAYRGRLGQSFLFDCPPNGAVSNHIYGSRVYTIDSKICTAAVHEGRITAKDGGVIRIEIMPGQLEYYAADKNGVPTRRYGQYDSSYKLTD